MENVTRFSVSVDPALLEAFDRRIEQAGYNNRSRAIGDIIRAYLVDAQWEDSSTKVVGTVTIVYDHHERDVERQLTKLQHDHSTSIACTTHVHLNHDDCLEVIVVEGPPADVRALADQIISSPGVKHGRLVCTAATGDLHGGHAGKEHSGHAHA